MDLGLISSILLSFRKASRELSYLGILYGQLLKISPSLRNIRLNRTSIKCMLSTIASRQVKDIVNHTNYCLVRYQKLLLHPYRMYYVRLKKIIRKFTFYVIHIFRLLWHVSNLRWCISYLRRHTLA